MAVINSFKIDNQILEIDKVICGSIDRFDSSDRGYLSQVILSQLRNFVDHIMLKIYANGTDIENSYENICESIEYVKTRGELKLLWRFYDYLQIVASHYTLDEENSERLMLKYYEYLLKIREFLKTRYSMNVLRNLDKFPINTDSNLKEYYEKIAEKLDDRRSSRYVTSNNDRFYIHKIKPFFVNQKIYYEVTFTNASERTSKFDRIIAFTDLDIAYYYAAKLFIASDSIEILGKTMPILIIEKWETSVRPCEINNFGEIFNTELKIQTRSKEYQNLMRYLSTTGLTLIEILSFPDKNYTIIRKDIVPDSKTAHFFDVLDKSREIIRNNSAGCNIIRYLLYHMNNKIIKQQRDRNNQNRKLSNLCLSNGTIPFDKIPFNTSLKGHNPKIMDLLECISATNRKHELFARLIRNNIEIRGQLYTSINSITGFENIDILIQSYNDILWWGHTERRLEIYNNHVIIKGYQDDTIFILNQLKEMTQSGIINYLNFVEAWLNSGTHIVDCEEKKVALKEMFINSEVALIYGSAGTGKSTMINHISHLFADKKKICLAHTNPAVDNLKRRVTASNCEFKTITKFLSKRNSDVKCDLLIIDECSTVSNEDMRSIIKKADFGLLILVGDIYQIEAIRFGNWFCAIRSFIPETSVFELTEPYRSKNKSLLTLWGKVRRMDDTIVEHISRKCYSITLDESIFRRTQEDEIILCLNYDGLYGINNINRFLQESNPNPAISWGIQIYKIDDPILFNESERFAPLIYNNMKGKIIGIEAYDETIQFDIELDAAINGFYARDYDFELLDNSTSQNSIIRFNVNKNKSTDEDDDGALSSVVPFQVAYAVSIHKAQGLEYDSVKIVITDEVDELITHNIFYTAITRARENLKIYWTPEVGERVLKRIKPKDNSKDVALLRTLIN